jgi:hypothetical protein
LCLGEKDVFVPLKAVAGSLGYDPGPSKLLVDGKEMAFRKEHAISLVKSKRRSRLLATRGKTLASVGRVRAVFVPGAWGRLNTLLAS